MAKMHSVKVERKLLSLLLQAPTHMRALNLNLDTFAVEKHQDLAELIRSYVKKYKAPPTKDTLQNFANKLAYNDEKTEKIVEALAIVKKLPEAKAEEAEYYFEQAQNYLVGRSIFDMGTDLIDQFSKSDVDFEKLKQSMISKLLSVGTANENVVRGFLHESAKERWERYNDADRGEDPNILPWGIKSLDAKLGGLRKTFLTLLYSETGGGKSRTAINIAYNVAKAGYNVMYFSLEMAFDLIAACFDSRMANVDSRKIIFGELSKEDKLKYKKTLVQQTKSKPRIWIADIAMGAKSSTILEEVAIYTAVTGVQPDLIIIDYANIMEPVRRYKAGDRSAKYDYLFQEFHEIAKYTRAHVLTATQESREAKKAQLDKSKNEDEQEGVHNIGLSHYMAVHCETVLHLKQDLQDRQNSRMRAVINKYRYGGPGETVYLTVRWPTTYVGDRIRDANDIIPIKKTKVKKR